MNEAKSTAAVTSLVAEVRVLMVGSRQVTLSVARQLDCVPPQHLEAWGRVRMMPGRLHLIGRRRDGTDLVVAAMPAHPGHLPVVHLAALPGKIIRCSHFRPDYMSTYNYRDMSFAWNDREFLLHARDADFAWCAVPEHVPGQTAQPCGWLGETGAVYDAIGEAIEDWEEDRDCFQQYNALPLIVLAGLR